MTWDDNRAAQVGSATSLDPRKLNVAVVGGTGGIGRAFSRLLARRGAQVLVVGRSFKDDAVPGLSFMKADLERIAEAERVAAELPAQTLDMIILTTGIMAGPKRETTSDGIERDLAVSYLSRFVIVERIAARLGTARPEGAPPPRIFVLGYPGDGQEANVDDLNSERSYARMKAHANTVAGNEVLVLDVAKRHPGLDAFGLNPGLVRTNIRANLFGSRTLLKIAETLASFMTVEPDVYAERLLPVILSPDLTGRSGTMFDKKGRPIDPTIRSTDPTYAAKLKSASERLVAGAAGLIP